MTKSLAKNALAERYEGVVSDSDSIEVSIGLSDGQRAISDRNLFSKFYAHCDGVVFLGDRYSVLSHYFNVTHPSESEETFIHPNIYLTEMRNELQRLGEGSLSAVVISGSDGYPNPRRSFNAIKTVLGNLQIPIVGEHYDRYGEFRDLVVIPKRKEVIMFEHRFSKFRKLT